MGDTDELKSMLRLWIAQAHDLRAVIENYTAEESEVPMHGLDELDGSIAQTIENISLLGHDVSEFEDQPIDEEGLEELHGRPEDDLLVEMVACLLTLSHNYSPRLRQRAVIEDTDEGMTVRVEVDYGAAVSKENWAALQEIARRIRDNDLLEEDEEQLP